MLVATIVLFTAFFQTPDKVVYKEMRLGLQFEHPKTWKVRRDKFSAVFEMPMNGGQKATVQLYNAQYKGTLDDWQLIQVEINKSMKRNVDRQWQEEFLGVPMALTKISFTDAGRGQTVITGLLYTSYADKMNFRLSSPAEVGEQAEAGWRDAMLTLRTVSGELPGVENPKLPSVKPELEKESTVWKPKETNKKLERGSVVAEIVCESTKYRLNIPTGWSIEDSKMMNKGLTGQVEILASVGIPEDAGERLVNSAKATLQEFESVSLREDPRSEVVKSGASVGRIFRLGKSKTGSLVLGSVVGYCEGVYWLLTYRATDSKTYAHDRQLLDELFRLLYAEKV